MTNIDWHTKAEELDTEIYDFIDGKEISHGDNGDIVKLSPRNGARLYATASEISQGAKDAMVAARSSFDAGDWQHTAVSERKAVLMRIAEMIEENAEELALCECLDVGKPITNARYADIPLAATVFRNCAEMLDKVFTRFGSERGNFSYVLRKPIGVVAAIVGWNFPLVLASNKIAPAIAMGNSVVLKPSEFSSLSAWRLAKLAEKAGLPPGVLNVVNGSGAVVGNALACSEDVDLLSFTGSTAIGKDLMIASGGSNMKRLMLECGGKSPYIVFEDCPADLDFVAADIVSTAFPNQGAYCSAGTRLLVHEDIKDELIPKIVQATTSIVADDTLDPATTYGAIINESHLKKILSYVKSGQKQGARLIAGGKRIEVKVRDGGKGYFLQPTVFDLVQPNHLIAQDEIFGPVLSILTFSDEAEAIKLANNSRYGLTAYVATENIGRAQRMAMSIRSGHLVVVGTANLSGGLPEIGGEPQRQSGFGAEGGFPGLEAYTVSTSVQVLT